MLKILIVTRSLPFHGIGGMEVVAWDLAKAFASLGHETIILTTPFTAGEQLNNINGVLIDCLDVRSGHYSPAWWKESSRVFEEKYHDVDVVLGVSAAANALVPLRNLKKKQIFVFQAHGTSWGEFISKLKSFSIKSWLSSIRNIGWGVFIDRIYKDYDRIAAVGMIVHQQLTEAPTRWLVGKTPVDLLVNGINEDEFLFSDKQRHVWRRKLNLKESDRVVLSISRLHPQKGILEGIRAFADAANEANDLYYLIGGTGPQEEQLRAVVKQLGLSDKIYFIGRLSRQEVAGLLSASDLFLFPSRRVEVGLTINLMEAMASGLPIATSITHGGIFAYEPICRNDHQGLVEAIRRTPGKVSKRTSTLPPSFTLQSSAQGYIDAFFQILTQK